MTVPTASVNGAPDAELNSNVPPVTDSVSPLDALAATR